MTTNVSEDRKRLKELLTDASELEREFLKKQEQQKKRVKSPENNADLDDEIEFLRNSLKDVYEDILLIDLKTANENNIEEKLWRNVFYSHIEELRQKLRKIKSEKVTEYQTTYLELCRYLDLGTGFYHTIVNSLKIRENIDLDRIGIEIFKSNVNPKASRSASKNHRKELSAECIQRCLIHLGDFSRYRETLLDANEKRWEFAKQFYTKAARVYCENGKAQAQLALLATYGDNELDVVYWYCFSLSTKQPPSISSENLKVFYSKFAQAQKSQQINENTNDMLTVRNFIKKFMVFHWYIFEEETEELIKNDGVEEIASHFKLLLSSPESNLHNLSMIFKKVIFILIFTIWNLRNGSMQGRTIELKNLQALAIGLASGLLIPILESINSFFNSEDAEIRPIIKLFLPTVILWCEYLGTLTDLLNQLHSYSKLTDKENQKISGMFLMNLKNFFKSFISIINNPVASNLLSANDDSYEIAKHAISVDKEFLGIIPLRTIHQDINFSVSNNINMLKVKIVRLIIFGKKISEIKSLDLLEYSETQSQFIMVDEESKKKERQRVMKLMAQQRLLDQVNDLEYKVKNIKPQQSQQTPSLGSFASSKNSKAKPFKHCVVDISVFLNHLNSVKKWIAEAKYVIIVPLEVIDSLDIIKKGNNKENASARDAIRFLDQQFHKISKIKQSENEGDELFIRAQQTNEKLPQWNCAEDYLIEDEIGSSEDVYNQKDIGEAQSENSDVNIKDKKFDIMDVPQEYRPLISCWLYYAYMAKMDEVSFVSENQDLKKYAKMFGISVVGVGFI